MATRKRRPLAAAVATIGIGCGALHAGAQDMALEEVVVTAQKKAESLQDTPISTTWSRSARSARSM